MREVYLFSSEDLELGSEVKWVTLTSASTDAATPIIIQVQVLTPRPLFPNWYSSQQPQYHITNYIASPFPFFKVIFVPTAMILPSPLHNLIFFPPDLINSPPPQGWNEELYIPLINRWLHVDPGEGVDRPLVYEAGLLFWYFQMVKMMKSTANMAKQVKMCFEPNLLCLKGQQFVSNYVILSIFSSKNLVSGI